MPRKSFRKGAQLLYLAICPVLFLVFVLVYEPARLLQSLLFIIPYLIVTIIYILLSFREKPEDNITGGAPDTPLVSFLDIYRNPRLIVAPSAVLYIEAKENYVDIHYTEDGAVKKFELRATMASLEEVAAQHGYIRCQRSFYVNPEHVTVLRKESGGLIFAELDESGLPGIPVSRKYCDELSKKL